VGKKYVWQVAASYNGFNLGETEIWTFEVTSSLVVLPVANNICVPKTTLGGGYYTATGGVLKFFYNNQYQEGQLNFKVYKQGEWITPITPPNTGSWDLGPQPGKNVLSLSLAGVAGITTGNNYVLVAVDKKGRKYYVEFLYSS
jgi:hypothetical protein